ncbi:uncharacterized protein LOC129568176 [Sitodiplosis mosellana]|uniref:uncharacterized protein LOC129568176 n=1 Tax=Sitodiplosis mosellana TaxID=263140 RepID=UPI0024442289|nr:uncharacterized protein LOC129568176 [Sitodiplosis mosellana]XP_055301728.1 uncharacterized protein LOC129568176 [Sitodiplosis mosellana]XP_055301729.1 uncharacterized protein LOC129568176 [Sitodiplosis mosellana]
MKMAILISLCFCAHSVHSIPIKQHNDASSAHAMNQSSLFENMDLVGLLKTHQKSEIDTFQRKYGSMTIAPISMDKINVHETAETIQSKQLVPELFHKFGPYIQKLELNYDQLSSRGDRKQIHKLIVTHCADSLISLSLFRWDVTILQSLNVLKKVENLTLTGYVKVSKGYFNFNYFHTQKKLNEIFPGLRRLSLDYALGAEPIFDVEFSQLEQVKITSTRPLTDGNSFSNTKLALKKLFSKNPQIRNFIYVYCDSLEILKMARDYLPNLETLQVNVLRLNDEFDGEKIYFANLKKAYLWSDEVALSQFLAFDQLDELYMTCAADECVNFIEQNKNMRNIFIAGNSLNDEDILEIGEEITYLDELFIATTAEIDTHTIIDYYKFNSNVKNFRLEIIDSQFFNSRMEGETLEKHFE